MKRIFGICALSLGIIFLCCLHTSLKNDVNARGGAGVVRASVPAGAPVRETDCCLIPANKGLGVMP